jgi:hypothetical protein
MEIKVCGPGCANCTKAENIVKEAVAVAGIDGKNGRTLHPCYYY